MIGVPVNQNLELPNLSEFAHEYEFKTLELIHFNRRELWMSNPTLEHLNFFETMTRGARAMVGIADNSRYYMKYVSYYFTFILICVKRV